MKKRFLIIPTICLLSLIPLGGCMQNDSSKNMRQPNIENIREQAPTPETDFDACPDCPDETCPDECPDDTNDSEPDNFLKEMPKLKPPTFGGRMRFDDKMPRIGAFGFMLIMPPHEKCPLPETPETPAEPDSPENPTQEVPES